MSLDLILSSLGWALLHSVWQGFLAAGVVYILRSSIKSPGASFRYSFQFLCLVACFIAFIVTFGIYAANGISGASATSVTTSFTEIIQLGKLTLAPSSEAVSTVSYTEILQKSSPLIGAVWIVGFIIVSLRCAISFQMTQALRKSGLSSVPQHWERRFRTLVLNAGLPRMAKIFISDRVSGPLTLGFFKPIVLVPASFFTQLPKDQIEAVLLHEIAHIRRHDYLLNIVQTAIKAVFFYHPGIHYISRRINEDREYACDDFSVNETKNPKALAKALAALRLQHPENSFAMAATGKSSPLMARLQRLVKASPQRRERGQASVPAIALLLSTAIYFSVAPLSQAHPGPEKTKSYTHAKHKLENYSFDVIDVDGRPVTVKITEDGRRWVLVDGAWYDVDEKKNRKIIEEKSGHFTYPPTPPSPPTPPVIGGIENAGSKHSEKAMRKFEKQMDQFEIDMEYFNKSLEIWSREYGQNYNEEFGSKFAEEFGTEFAENFSKDFGSEWSDEFREDFESNFAKDYSENYNKSFEHEGEDLEDMDEHPGSDHESAASRAADKRARMIERAEKKREKILARAMERAEEQREDALERMEEEREAALERMEDQREADLERMEERREEAMERAEEQRERAMERMERERERAKRALERAERDAERATHGDHTSLRKDLMQRLMKDGFISSTSGKATITYKNDHWVVNGTQIPSHKAGNYCDLFAKNGIKKSSDIKVVIKPDSLHVSTRRDDGSNHRVTIESFEHEKNIYKRQYKNKQKTQRDNHAALTPVPSFDFVTPVNGANIHLRFNEKVHSATHQGVDLGIRKGTPVYASANGKVDHVSTSPSWGKKILIEHKDGFHTVYANLDSFNVKEGQYVNVGDLIGSVGNTADVTVKPHLHFEIRHDGKLIDPEQIIPAF